MPLDSNPFQILTFIAAPAILTNASSVMSLGTSNRFARVIDRTRGLALSLQKLKPGDPDRDVYLRMLGRNERRGELLVRALRCFYLSLGCFAAAALTSLLGAIVSALEVPHGMRVALILALIVGIGGVAGLVTGCFLLVRETALAQANLRDESAAVRRQAAVLAT
jgi:hypothetical protein